MLIDTLSSGIPKVPDFEVGQLEFLVRESSNEEQLGELITKIKESNMAPYYHRLYYTTKLPSLEWDQSLYDLMVANNEKEVKELNDKIKEVEADEEGELQVVKVWIQLAEYYTSIGDEANAVATFKKVFDLQPNIGTKIDCMLTLSRLGFFFDDKKFTKKYLDEANSYIEKGGDWERKNRYKTYLGIYLMSTRSFEEASKLLIDSLATFTSTELTTYEQVAQFALISGAISLNRSDLKTKLIDSPEILSINSRTNDLLPVYELIKSLYFCEYYSVFPKLLETNELILTKYKYLRPHSHYYLREMRVKSYSQLLESYKSLSLKSMAEQFGVSIEFLDEDLGKFIPNKKLNCVIDKVYGIIETNRPDNKNTKYVSLIKNGDALLTKLQKYAAAVRLSGAEKI